MAGANLKLHGQFKFDLYSKNGEKISSSEYVDNFITNSGVMYPYHFAFADCFRFLSIGEGTAQNSIAAPATTGLDIAISEFSYIGGRSAWAGGKESSYYTIPGNFGAGCGFSNNPSGVSLFRQWSLPDNVGGGFATERTFQEFMVSPGRPYVVGATGKYCACNESAEGLTGLDCSSTSEYYRWLSDKYKTVNRKTRLKTCDATAAFSRILQPITAPADSILLITYKLDLTFDTGVKFTSLSHDRADSDPNWNHELNSLSSITQPGVMLINDGTVYASTSPAGNRLQHFDYSLERLYSFNNEYGESFVPPMGAPLEPSNFYLNAGIANQNIVSYFSTDNLQFLVNKNGGALDDISNLAYPISSGVMPFRNENLESVVSGGGYWSARPASYNIRKNTIIAPDTGNIASSFEETPTGYRATLTSLPVFNFPSIVPDTGIRDAKVTYTYNFGGYSSSIPLPIKSMVLAYKDLSFGAGNGDTTNFIPFFDILFSGQSGNSQDIFIPQLVVDGLVTGISGAANQEYNTIDSSSATYFPIINTFLSWNVPCPNGVNGCP